MSEACWLRNCPCQTGLCLSCQPTDDGCPVYRWFREIFKSKWISVKDRLPEECEEYIVTVVTDEERYVTSDHWKKQSRKWLLLDTEDTIVTHWMPLPEPPKEVNPND